MLDMLWQILSTITTRLAILYVQVALKVYGQESMIRFAAIKILMTSRMRTPLHRCLPRNLQSEVVCLHMQATGLLAQPHQHASVRLLDQEVKLDDQPNPLTHLPHHSPRQPFKINSHADCYDSLQGACFLLSSAPYTEKPHNNHNSSFSPCPSDSQKSSSCSYGSQ